MKLRFNQAHILLFVLALIVGLLGGVHLRSRSVRAINPLTPNEDLKKTVEVLSMDQADLKKQIESLNAKIATSQDQLQGNEGSLANEILELDSLKEQNGYKSVTGEGVIVKLDDSKSQGTGSTEDFIIHASDLRDVTNALWCSGAKAISINDERLTFSSSIDCLVNTILVGAVHLGPPFKILAVGNQNQMKSALEDKTKLSDIYSRVKKNNIEFSISEENNLTVPE